MHVSTGSLVAALRAAGYRITQARRSVCAVLAAAHDEHLTADAILERLPEDLGLDRSTVYRTLDTLEAAGLVRHGHIGHGPTVYHLADEVPHQHLVCLRCGRTAAIPETELAELLDRVVLLTGFAPDVAHFAMGGLCARCAANGAEPTAGERPTPAPGYRPGS